MRKSWANMRGKPSFVNDIQIRRGDPPGRPTPPPDNRLPAGIYAEPAGVVALAALMKMVQEKKIGGSDRVPVILSGSGWKDRASFISLKDSRFPQINPSLSEMEEALHDSTLHSSKSAIVEF